MNILYFCIEYHAPFGARTHAREFFASLRQLPGVKKSKVVPGENESDSFNRTAVPASEASIRRKLVRMLVPKWIRLVLLFLFPKKAVWNMLYKELATGEWDALVMRSGWSVMWVPRLKRTFPSVRVLLEVNSAMFDEGFKEVPFKGFWKRVEARAINAADRVTTVTANLRDYLVAHGVDDNKVSANQNGVNLEHFNPDRFGPEERGRIRNSFGIGQDTTVFGYLGGMQAWRRLPEVLQVFADVLENETPDACLLLVGDGQDMERLAEIRNTLTDDIRKKIILPGARPYEEVPGIMSIFDVALFPYTNTYVSPLKLFEYMAMGLPVIGPDTPGVTEVFSHNLHLRLVDQTDPGSFKAELQYCLNQTGECRAMAGRARELVEREYTWKRNAERVFALLERKA